MKKSYQFIKGFSLTELLIAVAIIALLSIIAIPSYQHYMKRTYYNEVVQAADRYKLAVALCLEEAKGVMDDCDGGINGVPADVTAGSGVSQVDSITVLDGVITVTPKAANSIPASATYVLTPTYNSATGVSWALSGGVCGKGLISKC